MRVPDELMPLVDMGVIDEVLRPLMAGKEAQVFLVRSRGETRVAKVYKDADHRSFKHRSIYAEGRRGRDSRSQRAQAKHTRHGRAEEESAWRSAEVDAIYRLAAAGVRVPEPYDFVEGVLVMSLVADDLGEPAPRLVDLAFTADEATHLFEVLVREVVKMLCAGLVHADLSDFNVLIGTDGPVIIDFPQSVDAASNNNARRLLLRDVRNLQSFLARFAPGLRNKHYGEEIWSLYERGELHPDSPLTGRHARAGGRANTEAVIAEIQAAAREERRRRAALGLAPPPEPPPLLPHPRQAPPRAEERGPRADGPPKRRRPRRRKRGGEPGPAGALAPRAEHTPDPSGGEADDLDALLVIGDWPEDER